MRRGQPQRSRGTEGGSASEAPRHQQRATATCGGHTCCVCARSCERGVEGEGCDATGAPPPPPPPCCDTFTAESGAEGEAACAGAPAEAAGEAGGAEARLRPAVSQPSGSGSGCRASGVGGSGFSASAAGEGGAAGRDGVLGFFFVGVLPLPSSSSSEKALKPAPFISPHCWGALSVVPCPNYISAVTTRARARAVRLEHTAAH